MPGLIAGLRPMFNHNRKAIIPQVSPQRPRDARIRPDPRIHEVLLRAHQGHGTEGKLAQSPETHVRNRKFQAKMRTENQIVRRSNLSSPNPVKLTKKGHGSCLNLPAARAAAA